jgi:hypothetical protein
MVCATEFEQDGRYHFFQYYSCSYLGGFIRA